MKIFYIRFLNALVLSLFNPIFNSFKRGPRFGVKRKLGLKNILERSKKSFDKLRTSAKKYSFLLCFTYTISADNTITFHRYLWANYNHFSGNIPHAKDWYTKLFSSNPSIYTYKGYLNVLAD